MTNTETLNLNTVLTEVCTNGIVKFPIYDSIDFLMTPTSMLDLDTRSKNGLMRNKMLVIYDILDNLERLSKIHGLGAKSVNRILYSICLYQYSLLAPEKQKRYLRRIIELNTESN